MAQKEVSLTFSYAFEGELTAKNGNVKIGSEEGTLEPYDLLLGALGSCLYSTFLDIAVKKRITYDRLEMRITGEKRTEIPATLKWVNVDVTVVNPEKQHGLDQALKLATEYCSVYTTISKVAEMSYTLSFA